MTSRVREDSNNLSVVIDVEGDSTATRLRKGSRVVDRHEGGTAVNETTKSPHGVGKSRGPNNLARVVDAESLGVKGTRESDAGENPSVVEEPMRPCAVVEVADNLADRVDAVGSCGSAVCGASAGEIDGCEDPLALQAPMRARALGALAGHLAGFTHAAGPQSSGTRE